MLMILRCLTTRGSYCNCSFWWSQWSSGLRPLACCGFESRRRHWCLSLVSFVCCQVEVSGSGWSLVQSTPTKCGVYLSVFVRPRRWGRPGPLGGCYVIKKCRFCKRSYIMNEVSTRDIYILYCFLNLLTPYQKRRVPSIIRRHITL